MGSFMPNYLKTASFFVHGEIHAKNESFLALCKHKRLHMNFHAGT